MDIAMHLYQCELLLLELDHSSITETYKEEILALLAIWNHTISIWRVVLHGLLRPRSESVLQLVHDISTL